MFKMFWKCEEKRYSKGCRCYKGAIGEEIGIIPISDCVAAWQTMNRERVLGERTPFWMCQLLELCKLRKSSTQLKVERDLGQMSI